LPSQDATTAHGYQEPHDKIIRALRIRGKSFVVKSLDDYTSIRGIPLSTGSTNPEVQRHSDAFAAESVGESVGGKAISGAY